MGAACLLIAAVLTAGPATPFAAYVHAVHVERRALDRLVAHPGAAGLARLRSDLQSLSEVRIPDGATVHTDLPLVARELTTTDRGSLRAAATRLDALDDALRAAHPAGVSRSRLDALDTVLRDSRFHPVRPPWAAITDKIAELQRRFLEWLLLRVSESRGGTGVFAVLLLLAVAGFGFLLARGALARMVVDVGAQAEEDAPTTSRSAGTRATERADAGDFREALRFLFLGTLLALQERGAIELRPGMTNREYIASARRTGMASPALDRLVDAFDRVWYGHIPIDAAEYARCRADAERALRESARGAA